MNRKSLVILFALSAAAGSSFAESYTEHNTPFVSTAARAEVAAQASQRTPAAANPWSTRYNPLAQFRSSKTRAQVTAEYIADRDVVQALTAEDSGSSYLVARRSTVQRVAGQPAAAQ